MFKKEIKKIMEPEEGELRQRGGITCAQHSIFKLRRALPGRAGEGRYAQQVGCRSVKVWEGSVAS